MYDEVRRQKTPLQEWFNEQLASTNDELIYKGASGEQIMWVRDELSGLAFAGLPYERGRVRCWVISEHYSKSVRLPVYSIEREDIGLQLVLRGNFYNWKLSCMSRQPIRCDFDGLFYTTPPVEPDYTGDCLHPVYFEGFPPEHIFGYYAPSDGRQWSAEIGGKHALWTTVFLIMKALGQIKPRTWHTRESHARELAADSARWRAALMCDKASRWFKKSKSAEG